MAGSRNRTAGHNYERDEVFLHRRYFPHLTSTRNANHVRDSEGIDICNSDELSVGRLPFDISCKSMAVAPPYHSLLKGMGKTDRIKVVLHRLTERAGTRMMVRGEYAILESTGYRQLLECAVAINHIRNSNPGLIDKLETLMGTKLLNIPQQQMKELGQKL